jgi:hypothetical protein
MGCLQSLKLQLTKESIVHMYKVDNSRPRKNPYTSSVCSLRSVNTVRVNCKYYK